MQVKKIRNADFHNANKLNGQATKAKYGVYLDGVQVGWAQFNGVWNAYAMDLRTRLVGYSCGSLSDLKRALASTSSALG